MDATFWAFAGLLIFLALMVYIKVPGMITKALDGRAEKVRNELEEARRLREEAQAVLADFRRKLKTLTKKLMRSSLRPNLKLNA